MARTARNKSKTGFYHVMLRGIGRQILFEDPADHSRFLDTLKRYLAEHSVRIHGYCLMSNHVHILAEDPEDELDVFMKKLEGSYAFYYNHRYERAGSLFQDRYRSEPVEDDAYFAVVLRYILQNPLKAGIGNTDSYRWSSFRELSGRAQIIHTAFADGIFGSRAALLEYVLTPADDMCLDLAPPPFSDRRAQEIITDRLKISSGTQLQTYEKAERDRSLRILKQSGLSVRQIERLTGINRGAITRA